MEPLEKGKYRATGIQPCSVTRCGSRGPRFHRIPPPRVPSMSSPRPKRLRMGTTAAVADSVSWRALAAHYDAVGSKLEMRQMFAEDPDRFSKFSLALDFGGGYSLPAACGNPDALWVSCIVCVKGLTERAESYLERARRGPDPQC